MYLLPSACLFLLRCRPSSEKGQPFKWTKECNDSFQQLKVALVSASVLKYPHSTESVLLDTDASNVGIGAVLSQVQNARNES